MSLFQGIPVEGLRVPWDELDAFRVLTGYDVENAKKHGAVGDGSTDDTAAIQAAIDAVGDQGGGIVYLPPGKYETTSALTIGFDELTLLGAGWRSSEITNAASDLLQWTATVRGLQVVGLRLHSRSGGGHVFNPGTNGTDRMHMERCYVLQDNDAQSVWHGDGGGRYIDNLVLNCWFFHTLSATVPTWNLVTGNNDVNSNTWSRCRFTRSGEYFIHLESTSGAAWFSDNVFRDITWEVPNGGCVRLLDCLNCVIENCNVYDMGTSTNHLYVLGDGSAVSPVHSRRCTIRNCERRGGTLGSGLVDIDVNAAGFPSPWHQIEHCFASSGTTFTIDLNSRNCAIRAQSDGNPIINNPGTRTIIETIVFLDLAQRHIGLEELSADPAAPAANRGRLYLRDNGAGKTELVVRFNTGAVQVIATEP